MWSGAGALLLALSPDSHRGPSPPSTQVMGPGITLLSEKLLKGSLPAGSSEEPGCLIVGHLDGSPDPEQDDLNPLGHYCSHVHVPRSHPLPPIPSQFRAGSEPPESCSCPHPQPLVGLIPPTTSLTSFSGVKSQSSRGQRNWPSVVFFRTQT